jgi:hypothetical protein
MRPNDALLCPTTLPNLNNTRPGVPPSLQPTHPVNASHRPPLPTSRDPVTQPKRHVLMHNLHFIHVPPRERAHHVN